MLRGGESNREVYRAKNMYYIYGNGIEIATQIWPSLAHCVTPYGNNRKLTLKAD